MADDLYVVSESFTVEVAGSPVAYRKGELVDPHDPVARTHRALLAPYQFPHPVKRSSPVVEQATQAPGERRRR